MILNSEQQAMVDAVEGVFVTIAGPGSGKTTTLIQRHINMMMSGIDQKDILNLTFTSSAAETMVKRSGLTDASGVFRTFHSLALSVMQAERAHIPFEMCDTILPFSMQDFQLLFDLVDSYRSINWRELKKRIEAWKCQDVMPDQALDEAKGMEYLYASAYRDYEVKCRQQGWLDFDDLMRETVALFDRCPDVLARYKKTYLAVDEAQDCDNIQFKLLGQLFKKNVFVVGDENQCIFEWRSAKPMNLTNFSQRFPGAKTMFLGKNYRSTQSLVSFFKEIVPIDNGIASHMTTDREIGIPPVITKYRDEEQEVEQVLRKIKEPEKSVIIARTNRQLFNVQKGCARANIKYKNLGKKDFWEQNEVKKLLELARKSSSQRPAAEVLTDLIQRYNLMELYRLAASPDSNPIENLNDIVKMSRNKGNVQEFLAWLKRLTYARKAKGPGLTLATVHQAKGLEWSHVYLIGVSQEKMPHKDGELNEEKRIFFVACSRAADTLDISFNGPRSMFLEDYQHLIEQYVAPEEEWLTSDID